MNATKPLNFKNTNRPGKRQARLVNYFTRLALTGTLLTAGITTGLSLTSCTSSESPKQSNVDTVYTYNLRKDASFKYTDQDTKEEVEVRYLGGITQMGDVTSYIFKIVTGEGDLAITQLLIGKTARIFRQGFYDENGPEGYFLTLTGVDNTTNEVSLRLEHRVSGGKISGLLFEPSK